MRVHVVPPRGNHHADRIAVYETVRLMLHAIFASASLHKLLQPDTSGPGVMSSPVASGRRGSEM